MGAENIIRRDASAAEATEDSLNLNRLAAELLRWDSTVTDFTPTHLLKMIGERLAHLRRRAKATFRFVLDRAHQYALHLGRDAWINLARARVLREIKYQKRIVLRVCACQQMKHRCA